MSDAALYHVMRWSVQKVDGSPQRKALGRPRVDKDLEA